VKDPLTDAMNEACKVLPDGWQILVTLERGSAWPELLNADGDNVTKEVNISDMDIHEAIRACTAHAMWATQ
jgi:hypothetical protein